jgi:putative ABC transport system permease protein
MPDPSMNSGSPRAMSRGEWGSQIRARLSRLRLSPAREREIVDELSQHLEDRWRELVAGGASPEEATRLTLADFSEDDVLARYMAPLRQSHTSPSTPPATPTGHLFGDLWQDLRYAARTLRKQPGFTIAAILTLALGIGANAAIFSVINAVLLRSLPFPQSDRLVAVYSRYVPATGYDFPYFGLSAPEFMDVRTRVNAFSAVAAFGFANRNLTRDGATAERAMTMRVTAPFFDVLGVRPARGRTFTEDEAQRQNTCLAVLPYDPADRSGAVLGSTIKLDDGPCEVIGIMPQGFGFRDDRVKVWTNLPINPEDTTLTRQSHGLSAIARLRDGVSAEQTDAELKSLWAYWSQTYGEHYNKGHFAVIRSLQDDIVGTQRDALLVLGGAVLFVLLIVCVNIAALLISRGEARRREFAVRHALGANRRRLVRQLVVEAMLLATLGGAAGILLGKSMLDGLLSLYPQRLPVWQPIGIDYAALGYTLLLIVIAGFLVGVIPALNATGTRMQETLRVDSRTATASRRSLAARSVLVVSQLALSVILLVGALLLIRSYQRLQHVDLGFAQDHLLTFSMSVPLGRQHDAATARRTLMTMEERLSAMPGVENAGLATSLPLSAPGPGDDFVIDGRPMPPPGAPRWSGRYIMATPHMFHALGIPLKRGRLLDESDAAGRPLVAVVNETAARMFWAGDDPIGKTIRYYPIETNPAIRIVGVVGDVRSLGATQPAPPGIYVSFDQAPRAPYQGRAVFFMVRVAGDPKAMIASARSAVAGVDSGVPLAAVLPMSEIVSTSAGQPRFTTLVMTFFAAVAFFLAALGLYGMLSYGVEQRVREIGVRVALGASRRDIIRLIVGRGLLLAIVGIVVGVPSAFALTRLMADVLSGITSSDPLTYFAVVALLMLSALSATYLPARRATRVDPLVALRAE